MQTVQSSQGKASQYPKLDQASLIRKSLDLLHSWMISPVNAWNLALERKRQLRDLDDHILRDIGLSREEIGKIKQKNEPLIKYQGW